ncbi:flagellin [Phenylobacterium sp.]|uniref:flagellin n=1 Tax=Phenylobacterium sp. TaxID=1871053 RepID=UPI0027292CCB|nr:flagellin [Phenylobacterium sp.]MDO8801509.1 flagellin [Phenylobacterium sp.]
MNRVSSNGNYSAVLANIQAAQQRQMEAGARVATQKQGTDLKGYARNAEMLTAMKSIDARIGGYLEQSKLITDKLTTQDFALSQLTSSAQGTRETIAQALASGRADTLMQDLQGFFRNSVDGLNARYGGKYVFAGGQIDTLPVSATALADLTNPAYVISDFFHNDEFLTQAKVDDSTTVTTGLLADDLGTDLLTAFKDIQAFEETVDGPFQGNLTDNQRTFLEGVMATWDGVHKDLINHTARNGMVQTRVDSVKVDLASRQISLAGMMGGITDADPAEAATALQQAGVAVQAAAQVFLSLQNSSLLNVLR